MKFIFCPHCQDIRRLAKAFVDCACGSSGGLYLEDGKRALISGDAIPFAFDNQSFIYALEVAAQNKPEGGASKVFSAFAISLPCRTIRRISIVPDQLFDPEAAWEEGK